MPLQHFNPDVIKKHFNPDATLWQRLENMTITVVQKLLVGTFIAAKEQKGKASSHPSQPNPNQ